MKKAYIGAAILALAGFSVVGPALAAPGHPQGGLSSTACGEGTVTWSPTQLWPPNHKMQDIKIQYSETDGDGDTLTIAVTGISDNQTTGGVEDPGSGNTGTDWSLGTPGMAKDTDAQPATTTAQVRSERSGRDGSRIYTINVKCSDSGGSNAEMTMNTATLTVTVPHDQGHRP